MLIKAYLKRYMFHLPMKDSELLNQIEEKLKKDVDKSNIYKMYPITKIEEDKGNILIEKQRTNIFLLNFLLLVLSHNKKEVEKQEYYNNEVIIKKLEEEIKSDLKGLPFEAVEKEVSNYLNPTFDKPQIESIESEKKVENEEGSHLENVRFSVSWLSGAQREIDGRE